MSQEYYLVCHWCKKKVHIGCVGMSGLQFWSGEPKTMKATKTLLDDCFLHLEKLGFVWEQTSEADDYEEVHP